MECKKLNLFPAKKGVSRTHSPSMIADQKALDHECNCKCQFGSFVQGYDAKTPHNTAANRAVDSIYLGATEDNTQGGHESLNLNIKRCYV